MKVLKFGGTSVGSPEALQQVKHIVEKEAATHENIVVVVSALSGVTDALIALSHEALQGDVLLQSRLAQLRERHHDAIAAALPASRAYDVRAAVDTLFDELQSILHGVYLVQDLTPKTADAIVAYGERLSSQIVAGLFPESTLLDARVFIKTLPQGDAHIVDFEATTTAVHAAFSATEGMDAGSRVAHAETLLSQNLKGSLTSLRQGIIVCGGFIASDRDTGFTTNLGRGGSDYTASILAAALDAESLEIWTDVDGFLTADPRIIPSAYTIPRLTYDEAMELCNFGAKVVYPPTIYPVCQKNIPLRIKNTFRPEAEGTLISADAPASDRPVRGISSINETSLIIVSGPSMVGVVGVNERIFSSLAQEGISVFIVAQSSSESSTSLGVTPADAARACEVLDNEFAREITDGAMNRAERVDGLSSIAVVGQRMKRLPGIAGKLFSVLGRNGISIFACALGALELNLSFVVSREQLRKTLSVLHDSFFLGEHEELNVFLCGTGTVGGQLLEQIAAQQGFLLRERGLRLRLVGVSGRSRGLFAEEGLNPAIVMQQLQEGEGGVEAMVRRVVEMNCPNSVFVDCTASAEVAAKYQQLLNANVSVVAANKIAASGAYEIYDALKRTARERDVRYLFETNVGAGLPIIGTINDLLASGDRVLRIEAVLSGTLNYVFNTLSASVPFSEAVRLAKENGYAEPDPRIDLSGSDVVRKITILARESGYRLETDDVARVPYLPAALFDGSLEDFWKQLPAVDADFEARRQRLAQEGKCWRYVATWEGGKASVALKEIPSSSPFYHLEGSNNILLLTTERYRQQPMLIQGYGAGAAVTAAGVFADILRCVR